MNTSRIFSSTGLILGTLAFSLGLQAVAAFEQPASAPPGGDAAAPLNTSIDGQTKQGGLVLGTGAGVTTALRAYTGNIYLDSGSITVKGGPLGTNGAKITTPSLCLGTDCRSVWPAGSGGGITSLTAGSGITFSTGATITTTGTVSADLNVVQKKLSGTCLSGAPVIAISPTTGIISCGKVTRTGVHVGGSKTHTVTFARMPDTSYTAIIQHEFAGASDTLDCRSTAIANGSKTETGFVFTTGDNCADVRYNWMVTDY